MPKAATIIHDALLKEIYALARFQGIQWVRDLLDRFGVKRLKNLTTTQMIGVLAEAVRRPRASRPPK